MKLSTLLIAGTALAGLALAAPQAQAAASVCAPGTSFSLGICNLEINFLANGSITTTIPAGASTTYDGVEDALIGVINNSGHTVSGFHLTGSNIGGFDNDGIDTFFGGPVAGNPDTTGYGGPLGFFSNNTGSALDITFFGGIANGSSTYFSLEEPASLSIIVTPTPEPASIALFGAGLLGLGLIRRKRA